MLRRNPGIIMLLCFAVCISACSQRSISTTESSLPISSDSEPELGIIDVLQSDKFNEIIKKPDIIICYVNGTEITIESTEQIDDIFDLSQASLSKVSGQYGLDYEETDVLNAKEKGIILEFIYNDRTAAEWKYKPDYSVKYEYNLVTIVIDGGSSSLSKMVIIGDGTPTPTGDFTASNDLLQLIDNL